jgi:hypothetical protein
LFMIFNHGPLLRAVGCTTGLDLQPILEQWGYFVPAHPLRVRSSQVSTWVLVIVCFLSDDQALSTYLFTLSSSPNVASASCSLFWPCSLFW